MQSGTAPHIFVLTGAGISAASGLATFRGPGGLWETRRPEDLATPEAFATDPDLVHRFYNYRRARLRDVEPNAAHDALARLAGDLAAKGGHLTLVTQNVDDLHERAGSVQVLHMHGELCRIRCTACGHETRWEQDLSRATRCPGCDACGHLRPAIVWFGETPLYMDEIVAHLSDADHFAAIGTSGAVYPAAGFVAMARQRGIPCTELNLEPSDNAHLFTDSTHGPAAETVPRWAEALVKESGT